MGDTNWGQHVPQLTFTVAVTGHRAIPEHQGTEWQAIVTRVLADARTRLLAEQACNEVDGVRDVQLRFFSALAPGADQIGARAMLTHDRTEPVWQFRAVLPFAREDYAEAIRRDGEKRGLANALIEEAITEMERLRAQAGRVLELADWSPAAANPASDRFIARRYATLGSILVRNADLLIALWDGNPPKGPGGTADVVREARASGVPVVWLNVGAKRPGENPIHSLIPDPAWSHLPILDLMIRWRSGDATVAHLVVSGETAAIAHAARHVLLGAEKDRAAQVSSYAFREPSRMWLCPAEQVGQPEVIRSGTQAWLYSFMLWLLLLGTGLRSWPFRTGRRNGWRRWWWPLPPFLMQPAHASFDAKLNEAALDERHAVIQVTSNDAPIEAPAARADAIATRLGHLYRSAYVAIFGLAALAVAWALAYVFYGAGKPAFVGLELMTVLVTAILFWRMSSSGLKLAGIEFVQGRETHRRWMDARLVAESQRGGQLMAWIGFSGRRPVEDPPSGGTARSGHQHEQERVIWTPHFANAVTSLPDLPAPLSDAGLTAKMDAPRIALVATAAAGVISHQLDYHVGNAARLTKLHHRLDTVGLGAIGIAFVAGAAYLLLWNVHSTEGSLTYALYETAKILASFLGGVGPAVAAAAAGIRYHGDFERFAMRSRETAARLEALSARAHALSARAKLLAGKSRAGLQPPLFEELVTLLLDTQGVLDEDLADWRFAYAARPLAMG